MLMPSRLSHLVFLCGAAAFVATGCETTSSETSQPAPSATAAADTGDGFDLLQRHRAAYIYEHRILPRLAHESPQDLAFRLEENGAQELRDIWMWIEPEYPEFVDAAVDSIQLEKLKGPDVFDFYLITFPEARQTPEAIYAIFVYPVPNDNPAYYTLEKSFDHDGQSYTAFCAWEGTRHLNFGMGVSVGPEEDRERFIEAVSSVVQQSAPVEPNASLDSETSEMTLRVDPEAE